jgi:hypothetical protein
MADDSIARFRDFVQVITQCSPADAYDAENAFCSSPDAQKAFLVACGGSMITTVYGAYLFRVGGTITLATGGTSAPTTVPAAAIGLVLATAGGFAVKRFCIDLVTKGIDSVSQNQVHYGAIRDAQE